MKTNCMLVFLLVVFDTSLYHRSVLSVDVTINKHNNVELPPGPQSMYSRGIAKSQDKEIWKCSNSSEAKSLIIDICTNYPFIRCEYNSDNTPKCREGTFGFALWAELRNNPLHKVEVYENCKSNAANITEPVFTPDRLVASSSFPVVIKFNRDLAETSNTKKSLDSMVSALHKEIRRGRGFASRRYDDGTRMSPKWFDIRDLTTNKWHTLHNRFLFMERIQGVTAYEILLEGLSGEQYMMESGVLALFSRGSVADTVTPAEHEKMMQLVATRSVEELWLRARYRLSLLDTVGALMSELLRQTVFHCDLHLGNMMLLTQMTTSADNVLRHIKKGDAVFEPIQYFWTSPKFSDYIKTKVLKPEGVPYWSLSLKNMRLIDTGMGIDFARKLKTVEGKANLIEVPCRIWRSNQLEDVMVFSRTLGIITTKTDIADPDFTIKSLTDVFNQTVAKLKSTKSAMFKKVLANGDQKYFVILEKAASEIEGFFKDLSRQIFESVPELTSCYNNWREFTVVTGRMSEEQLKKTFQANTVEQRIEAEKRIFSKCNVLMMKDAVSKSVTIIRKNIALLKQKLPVDFEVYTNVQTPKNLDLPDLPALPMSLVPMSLQP